MHHWGSKMCCKVRYMKSFHFSRFPQEFQATCIVKPMRNLSICISCMKQRKEMTHKQYTSNSFPACWKTIEKKDSATLKTWNNPLALQFKKKTLKCSAIRCIPTKESFYIHILNSARFPSASHTWNKNRQALDWRNEVFYASKFCCFNAKFSHTHSYTKQSYLNPLHQLLNFWHIFLKNAITTFYITRFELGSRLLYGIFGAI